MRLLAAAAIATAVACAGEPREMPGPLVVVGVDAADWGVIEYLWDRGLLPNLKALAERGPRVELGTGYDSKSAVVWNTIATGVVPERHGITDFVVAGPEGRVPVSSGDRKVPALWHMAGSAGRSVAVLSWWATWPAEPVRGVLVSDRVDSPLADRVYPAEMQPEIDRELKLARDEDSGFPLEGVGPRDRLVARLSTQLAGDGYDLMLVYLKSVDWVGHRYWKYFDPDDFAPIDPAELEAHRDRLPDAYQAVDRTIGRLVAAAGPRANIVVLSDHGFYGLKRERVRFGLDLDLLFERTGLLARGADGIDFSRSTVYTHLSPKKERSKLVRFSMAGRERDGMVEEARMAEARSAVEERLRRITWRGGQPAVRVRDPLPDESEAGADLVIQILTGSGSYELFDGARPLEGVTATYRYSGSHGGGTDGIFLAVGPDIDPAADLDGMDIHDVAPTLLYAMNLPIAEDFDGTAFTQLMTAEFRSRYPVQTIPSWGTLAARGPTPSAVDEQLIEDLRALGYLD